jgi:dTDP-4-amino-4,6-dideoxygalactose transaminase
MGHPISLSRPYFDDLELEAVRRVLESGWVVQGPEVEAFEGELARLHRARHCIAVSSGTAALHICYLALGVGAGDAGFVPSFAWPSGAHMLKIVGATPVFVDVFETTYNVDRADLVRRIEDCLAQGELKPKLIVPVHEFGLAAEMDAVLAAASKYSLEVIEDAACALGATYHGRPVGTFGKLGILSFHPRKSITTGEGGAILTDDSQLAERCRCWRNHGQQTTKGRREFVVPGLNYRMTEIQAVVGRVQLSKFPSILKKRRTLVQQYFEELKGCEGAGLPANSQEHTWQTMMVRLAEGIDRGQVIEKLAGHGIEAGPGSVAAHLAAHFQPQTVLPISEKLHRNGLALPLHAGLDSRQVSLVTRILREQLDRFKVPADFLKQAPCPQNHLP